MSDNNQQEDVILDGSDLKGYKPREGGDGPAGVFKMDGFYRGPLSENFKFGTSEREVNGKKEKNTWINIAITTADDSPNGPESGKVVYGIYSLEGVQEDGPQAGRKNMATLMDLCIHAGRTDLAAEMIGKYSLRSILTRLTAGGNTMIHFRAQTRKDKKGVLRTEPRYFIAKEMYETSLKTGKNFRVEPKVSTAKTPSNGVSHGTGATDEGVDALAEAIA